MKREIWSKPKQEKSLDEAQTPLWFWNDELETEELIRQLKLQTEVGVKCTNPHARTNGGEGYIGGYLDERWFRDMKTVLDYKKENGEKMWLYDEMDWPAGTCNKTITKKEQNREQYVTVEQVKIPAGRPFRAQIQTFESKGLFGMDQDTDYSEMAFNIHILDAASMQPYDVTDFFIYDRFGPELEFSSDRPAIAYITRVQVDPYEYRGDGQVSYLNPEATREFLESTYDKYYEHFGEDFGTAITTIFNDETRMCHPIAWSREFAEVFQARKGYDIRKELYRVVISGEEAGRVRCDYFDVLAYLFQTNYFGEIHKWCKAHNLKLFAHLLGEETLLGHTRYSGDYMRQNKYQDICGADHLGKGIGSLNIKFTSCGAHSYGKKRTAVEVFAGCGWDMTFEEYIRMITWMFQQGMQIIINHGFFYSDRGNRKNDWPPSQFFQWKGWHRQSEGNDMIRRLHYGLTDGINEADVLVYLPLESFWLHYLPDQHFTHGFFHGPFTEDDRAEYIDREIQLLLNGLSSRNQDFDLLHKDAAENFTVKSGKIVNKVSGQKFSVLLLPVCEVLPVEVARLCESFASEGGRIIAVDELPHLAMNRSEDGEVRRIVDSLRENGSLIVISADHRDVIYDTVKDMIPQPIRIIRGTKGTVNNHPNYVPCLIDPYMHGGEDLSGVLFIRYLKDGRRNSLFMNYSNSADTIEVLVQTAGGVPEIWDTLTGEMTEAEVVQKEANGYRIRLILPCDHGVFVISEL